ncbi:MAG: nicotinamide-nucleotide amidohydrolase family protein [Vicinamibacteria bacterium]
MGESEVDQRTPPSTRGSRTKTTILGAAGQVELHLVAHGDDEADAERRIETLAVELRAALPGRFFSEDGRELPGGRRPPPRAGQRIGLAESCTGRLLASRLTGVPGASLVLERGFVTYANRAKVEALGVDEALLARHGAVSEEVAAAMAAGARRVAGADVGVAITGIAGPDGGTPEKPVGLVFVAIDGAAARACGGRCIPAPARGCVTRRRRSRSRWCGGASSASSPCERGDRAGVRGARAAGGAAPRGRRAAARGCGPGSAPSGSCGRRART